MSAIIENWEKLLLPAGFLAGAIIFALLAGHLLFAVLRRIGGEVKVFSSGSFERHCRKAVMWIIIVIGIYVVLPTFGFSEQVQGAASHILSLLLIVLVLWLLVKSTGVLEDYLLSKFDIGVSDNLAARKIHTQFKVLKSIIIFASFVLALAVVLMTIPKVRQLGTTILASAGIIGIVVGMAAQKTIGNFIAGLQLAFTQPIRLDDVVIVEGEWGRIEEITLTYVVVKIWDLRRLVIPITYFIEKPFQNWTRTSAEILGSVFIYVDYTIPVDIIRAQLQRILEASEFWDKKVCVLQATNCSERTVELRALMSAADASTAWSLRCEVREKLIKHLQEKYPDCLPKVRAELSRLEGQSD